MAEEDTALQLEEDEAVWEDELESAERADGGDEHSDVPTPPLGLALQQQRLAKASHSDPQFRHHSQHRPKKAEESNMQTAKAVGAGLCLAIMLGAWATRKFLGRRGRKAGTALAADYSALTEAVHLEGSAKKDGGAKDKSLALNDISLAFSPLLDVQGRPRPHAANSSAPESTAAVLQALVDAGVRIASTTTTEELYLGLQADEGSTMNPLVPDCPASGTGAGVATAVAAGLAVAGIGVDHVAGLKVHASTSGLYCCRVTPGVLPSGGVVPVAGTLDSLSLVSRDPHVLQRIGSALKLPGGSFHKGKLLRLVIAEDLFSECDEVVRKAKNAFVYAAHKWPGNDYVQPTSFAQWLAKNVPSARHLLSPDVAQGSMMVLEAIRHAGVALQYREFLTHHGDLGEPSSGPLNEELAEQLDNCRKLSNTPSIMARAEAVQQELSTALREVCKDGLVFVLPALPAAPPARSGNQEEWNAFEAVAMQFGAIAALAGIPQVNVPIDIPGQGPLSIALLGLAKSDMSLIDIALRMAPLINKVIPTLNTRMAQEDDEREEETAGARARRQSNSHASTASGSGGEAEAFKEKGNTAFKAEQYGAAVQHYTSAIEVDRSNSVYYSNRAMAFLKLMQWESAEADCTRSLRLKPAVVKTLMRRGTARGAQGKLEEAISDYRHVLSLEPNNRQARSELKGLQSTIEALDPSESEALQNGHANEPQVDESHMYS
ncbi:hypothetical protein WJX73_002477 [Symbiochloris irregularis]|uniref:Amidase domain-containing protein n=1 Tax=Symbiochloris irregularis TaxID=706552 RepID=A0AAW1NTU8_9CHLO